jgi:hypothetical protein
LAHKFSIPIPNSNIQHFITEIRKRKEYIHDIYFSTDLFPTHLSSNQDNVEYFLQICGDEFNTTITLNAQINNLSAKELKQSLENVKNYINKYKINGVIFSDYYVGEYIRNNFPDILLYTSCNIDQYTIEQCLPYKEGLKVDYYNLPREYGRRIDKIKEFHDKGFKTKILINEGCVLYCVNGLKHRFQNANNNVDFSTYYFGDTNLNTIKSCLVLPKWLKYINDYVDILKIEGKTYSSEFLINTLDCYIEQREDVSFNELWGCDYACPSINKRLIGKINTNLLPDKLMFCHNQCDECSICSNLAQKFTLCQKIMEKTNV